MYFIFYLYFIISFNLIFSSSTSNEYFDSTSLALKNDSNLEHKTTINNESYCKVDSSIDDFPPDIFTNYQRTHGVLLLHVIGAIYFFTLLAVVCNDYFLPSVECICTDLNISKDVAAATFMATATTVPELFTNVITTFITQSGMGIGTIIGSLMFNTLGVAAIAGLLAKKAVHLDWWPISRDCVFYTGHLIILIIFAWDSIITLTESIVMVCLGVFYYIVMFQNDRFLKYSGKFNNMVFHKGKYDIDNDENNNNINNNIDDNIYTSNNKKDIEDRNIVQLRVENNDKDDVKKNRKSLWRLPSTVDNRNFVRKIWWFYTWPIKLLLTLTIPSPKTWRKLYPLTFVICIFWIGVNSYMIVWMLSILGFTLRIPESVMGFTFLAAGGCLPEAISSVIMIRKGESGIGVSNSLGANSLAILFSLGLPWLIRNIISRDDPQNSFIFLETNGVEYIMLLLLIAVLVLYVIICIGKYELKLFVGIPLLLTYLILLTLGILIEMDVILPGNKCIL